MASVAPAKFRIDVDIHNLLINSHSTGPLPRNHGAPPYPSRFFLNIPSY